MRRTIWRLAALIFMAALGLQAGFAARIALMARFAPHTSAMQRSEMWRQAHSGQGNWAARWQQQWVDEGGISPHLMRAVLAAEDDGFIHHSGVDWDAIRRARLRNARRSSARPHGGSTITQQLAKNLFLSGERTLARKAQELVLALALEALLDKRRILTLYLNTVEWGEGIWGAEAAARHYFGCSAAELSAPQAAQLAVLLPAPRRYGAHINTGALRTKARRIAARMSATPLP